MKRNVGLTRSPLLPGSPSLPRTGWTVRNRGLRSVSARRESAQAAPRTRKGSASGKLTPSAPREFTAKVKDLVRRRAGRGDVFEAACEACGAWLGEKAGEFQHRAARGAGGCRDAVINGPANAVLLCGCAALRTGCHALAETRDDHMKDAGFWLEHGTTPEYDPRNAPIMLHGNSGGITVYLAEDGIGFKGTGYLYQAPEVEAA